MKSTLLALLTEINCLIWRPPLSALAATSSTMEIAETRATIPAKKVRERS